MFSNLGIFLNCALIRVAAFGTLSSLGLRFFSEPRVLLNRRRLDRICITAHSNWNQSAFVSQTRFFASANWDSIFGVKRNTARAQRRSTIVLSGVVDLIIEHLLREISEQKESL